MLNEKVNHIKFGSGVIVNVSDMNIVTVKFEDAEGEKTFKYPDGFKSFLNFENGSLQEKAMDDLDEKNAQNLIDKERQRAEAKEKYDEEVSIRMALEKEQRKEKRLRANKK